MRNTVFEVLLDDIELTEGVSAGMELTWIRPSGAARGSALASLVCEVTSGGFAGKLQCLALMAGPVAEWNVSMDVMTE